MYNGDIISMPDKWEYPWYAAWDLAFHVVALTMADPDFGTGPAEIDEWRTITCTPTDKSPRTNGISATSIRPCMLVWSTVFTYMAGVGEEGGRRQGMAQRDFSEAASQFHLVGESQGPFGTERV